MIDREKQERERAKILEEVVALSKEHKHLVINLPTGTGKGLAVAQCIRASESKKQWVILVPEITHIQNYKNDLIKHNNQDLLDYKIAGIMCYASVHLLEGSPPYNIHLNESHRISEYRMDVVKSIDFDQIISDSATINDEIGRRLNEIEPFYKYSKSLQEVIDLGILPQPEIVCVGVKMSKLEEKEYNIMCSSIQYLKGQYEREGEDWRRIRWLGAGNKRKTWMSDRKTEKARKIIESFGGERFIVFTGSINQAIDLGGERAIHSKNGKSKQVIEDFNNGVINSLYTCNMIREGQNLTNTKYGLLIQIDGEIRRTIQSIGRLMRHEYPEVYILYIKNSQDENYLKKFLRESKISVTFV